jgi:hypothetical protein
MSVVLQISQDQREFAEIVATKVVEKIQELQLSPPPGDPTKSLSVTGIFPDRRVSAMSGQSLPGLPSGLKELVRNSACGDRSSFAGRHWSPYEETKADTDETPLLPGNSASYTSTGSNNELLEKVPAGGKVKMVSIVPDVTEDTETTEVGSRTEVSNGNARAKSLGFALDTDEITQSLSPSIMIQDKSDDLFGVYSQSLVPTLTQPAKKSLKNQKRFTASRREGRVDTMIKTDLAMHWAMTDAVSRHKGLARIWHQCHKCCHLLRFSLMHDFRPLVESRSFDYASATAIILNAFFVGIQADFKSRHLEQDPPVVFRVFDLLFCFLFTTELVLRLLAYRTRFFYSLNMEMELL